MPSKIYRAVSLLLLMLSLSAAKAEEPAAQVERLTLGGRVVTAEGKTLAGARVEARPEARGIGRESGPDDGPPPVTAESDADGRFRLLGIAPGTRYQVTASRPGYARTTLPVPSVELGKTPEELVIPLARGIVGFGRVLDVDEQPIVGARVELRAASNGQASWRRSWAADSWESATGARGGFEVPDLAPGLYALTASAPGYREVTVPGIKLAGKERFDLGTVLLGRGRRLAGRVSDPAGRPVDEAQVAWRRIDQAPVGNRPEGSDQPRITGSDGKFTLEGLPPDAVVEVVVRREGFQLRRLGDVESSRQEPLDIVLEPGVILTGEVVDAAGRPVADAAVELVRSASSGLPATSVATDAEGRFELSGLAPGRVTLSARTATGSSSPRELALQTSDHPLTVRLELQAGATVSGWVLDPEGAGVAGSVIEVQDHRPGVLEPRLGAPSEEWKADGQGHFKVTGLAGGRYRLTARHPDYVSVTAALEVGGQEVYPMDLEFSERRNDKGLLLAGRVVDSQRRGVQGAAITLIPVSSGDLAQTASHGDGRFRIRAAVHGEYFVEVRHPRFAATRSHAVNLDSGPVEELVVELGEGGSISGSVRGLAPDQLAQLRILAFSQGVSQEGQVGYDGGYRLDRLATGTWTVQAQAGRRSASGTATLAAAGDRVPLDLRFEPGFRLSGTALLEGDPLAEARIDASCPEPGFNAGALTDGEGRFELRDVPQGRCTLTLAAAARAAFARREVEVRGDTEVEIELVAAAVSGQVLSLQGHGPIAGATVELVAAGDAVDPRSRVSALTDANGRFSIATSARGTARIRVTKESFALLERQVELDARRALQLLLQPAEAAVLYVVGPDGEVPARVDVEVRSATGEEVVLSRSYQPELDGEITLHSLPPGFWQLHVTGRGLLGRAEIVVPGKPARIVLGNVRPLGPHREALGIR